MPRITGVLLLLAGLSASGLAPAPAAAQSLRPVPTLEARVTDQTGTLTAAQQAQLETKLAEFESRKGAQIAVLIVPSTAPEAIEQYSIRVVDAWKLGRAKPDDGALLTGGARGPCAAHRGRYQRSSVLTDFVSRHAHRRHHHAAVPAG
ncbi:MAG: TPM domain-containing protein [Steroidobacteraceae bacterium]